MPELPEVETVKNDLSPVVLGQRITDVTLVWEGIVRGLPVQEFRDIFIFMLCRAGMVIQASWQF